jgi:Fic family protein
MRWNWQDPNWPNFRFRPAPLAEREGLFLRQSGVVVGTVRHVPDEERLPLIIELISTEALKTSEIEGEILDRESVNRHSAGNLACRATGRARRQPSKG